MVILWTQFVSRFLMVYNHPIFDPVIKWSASLHCFKAEESYKCFYFYKSNFADYLITGHECLVFKWLWQPSCFDYSQHPKVGLVRVSNGRFQLVPGIWMPDHSKPGQKRPRTSLDRFIKEKGHKKYFIHAKRV
jgi:hypothetical protein